MGKNVKRRLIAVVAAAVCICGRFIYEVNREHHYTPVTAEIVPEKKDILQTAFVLKDNAPVELNLSQHLRFVSDVENGSANLETKKKVFGFYECDINRVYDEYLPTVTYSIGDSSIATVDENGVVTAIAKGQTSLTVTADDISIELPVTVYRGVKIDRLEQNVSLIKGESKSFLKVEEFELPLSQFYSSNENVVTVDKNGTANAVGKGTAEIYTFKDEVQTEKISTKVVVKQPVESVTMKHVTVYVGETATLKGSYAPRDADYGTKLSYKSENPEIATVSGNTVTGVKAGDAAITITSANGKTGKAGVTVVNPPRAVPVIHNISKSEFESYTGEKFTDNSPYASYFTIAFDQPVMSFRINEVDEDEYSIKTGSAIYNNAQVPANTPLYFAICVNQSDVVARRGFSYVNKDGSLISYWLHFSGWDGSITSGKY